MATKKLTHLKYLPYVLLIVKQGRLCVDCRRESWQILLIFGLLSRRFNLQNAKTWSLGVRGTLYSSLTTSGGFNRTVASKPQKLQKK